MSLKNLGILFFIVAFLFYCGGNSNSRQQQQANNSKVTLPGLPEQTLINLWEQCDFLDYIWYNASFSMSQEAQRDIRAALEHIGTASPGLNAECQPAGRIFYQIDGSNVLEADIFISEQCTYFVFHENGQRKYANSISESGLAFFKQIFAQMQQSSQSAN